MQKITPFLWYDGKAQEAAEFYVSVFKNGEIISSSPMSATFRIEGQEFHAFNGGPMFHFTEAVSLFVSCDTQEEIDELWAKLTADGGEDQRCGWIKDKYGLSWQLVPPILSKLLGDPDQAKSQRVMQAMLGMNKLDIAGLKAAAEG